MTKILFICHGNICRSPMAEFVMKHLVEEAGRSAEFSVASAATHTDELGNAVHHGTRRKLQEHGISCAGKTARLLTAADYARHDLLVAMDSANLRHIRRICGDDGAGKVHLLLDYAGRPGCEVADPWYTGDFEATWRDVLSGCRGLLAALTN